MGNILLAHESKTVRATLKAYLKSAHKVLEASDSDAAWHLLVLHSNLNAVIAGPDLGMSSGLSLLGRARGNNLLRLKQIPFYFIGSETRIAELTADATKAGANGFLHTGMKRQEVLDILHPAIGTIDPEESTPPPQPAPKPTAKPEPKAAEDVPFPQLMLSLVAKPEPKAAVKTAEPEKSSPKRAIKTGLIETAPLSPRLFEDAVSRQYSVPGQKGAILCCAIANYPDLVMSLGERTAASIASKLVKLAQSRISGGDTISLYSPGVFTISTIGGTLATCAKFAAQLEKNLASAKIAVQGTPLSISIISAFAAIPEDGNLSGKELLELAKSRLVKAMQGVKK